MSLADYTSVFDDMCVDSGTRTGSSNLTGVVDMPQNDEMD